MNDTLQSHVEYYQSRLLFRVSNLFDTKRKKLDKSIDEVVTSSLTHDEIRDLYHNVHASEGKNIIVATHSGRSGLNWLARVLSSSDSVVAAIEPFPFEESFFRFITWHKLDIDYSFLLRALMQLFVELWKDYDTIIYASPWINGGLEIISDELSPDQLFVVIRDPRKTVTSFVNKGWYQYQVNFMDQAVPMPDKIFRVKHHYFSRVEPNVQLSKDYEHQTLVGRASWYWNSSYKKIFEVLDQRFSDAIVFRLEDIDESYSKYQDLCMALKIKNIASNKIFQRSRKRVPNMGKPNTLQWNDQFEFQFLAHAELFYANRYQEIVTSV